MVSASPVFITFAWWFILVLLYFLLALSEVQRCREGGSCPAPGLLRLGERGAVDSHFQLGTESVPIFSRATAACIA